MNNPEVQTHLPENAYRELKPGESYTPMVPASVTVPEITLRSILFGIAMNVLFSMAATYLALKIGQGIETAIPISILSVGLSGALLGAGRRATSLLEHVNVLAISTTSGIVAGGTVFTMPAIYILKLHETLGLGTWQLFLMIFLVPLIGAILGVLLLVPFRRYFVKDMHGKLPFPEATATNEILVTGSGGGAQAATLIYAFLIGMVYNWLSGAMKLFSETFTTAVVPVLEDFNHRVKAVFSLGTGAEFVGLGYIIGIRFTSIIVAGSFLSCFVIIPLLAPLDLDALRQINPQASGTSATAIFLEFPRSIGIGCIFAAGVISILKMGNVIVTALRQAIGGLFTSGAGTATDRTDQDISYPVLLVIGLLLAAAMWFYFRFVALSGMEAGLRLSLISLVLALGVAFIFTTVSAWAIAMISVTPISGMTVTTIIITAVVLLAVGLPKSDAGMLATLMVGGVVAAALSMAGTLVTEFKIGYWVGASPRRIQWSAILAAALASAVVTATIMLLNRTYGYDSATNTEALQAPQANLMATALKSFIGTGDVPWTLYGVGVVIAVLMQIVGVSPLAFGLGMYLPMELNSPLLVGAIIAWLVRKSTKDEKLSKARNDKGILIASGLIAGAAILGVIVSILKLGGGAFLDIMDLSELIGSEALSNWLGLVAFVTLCIITYRYACRAKAPLAEPAAAAVRDTDVPGARNGSITCSSCGASSRATAKYCHQCGRKL